jgi:spore coat protein U-like protein
VHLIPHLSRLISLGWLLLAFGLSPAQAQAPSCTFGFSSINFGNVDVTSSANTDITGTFTVNCSGGVGNQTVRICPHLAAGSEGAGANGSPRYMKSGANSLTYNLHSDSGHTTVWGSNLAGWSGVPPPQIDLLLDGTGAGSTSRTVYGRVPGSQSAARVGTYLSSFAGFAEVRYAYTAAGDCATMAGYQSDAPSFTVQATVEAMCTVSASPLNFGAVGLLNVNHDATSSLSVVCTRDANYAISLGSGLNDGGAGVGSRRMKSGSETIGYQLYRDSDRALVWGDSAGVNTKAASGTGGTDNHFVYGRVPPQSTPSPGTYTDTVVVTVTY